MTETHSKILIAALQLYIEKGYQLLNGEQALALSRNRKNNWGLCPIKYTYGTRNDFVRNKK